MKLIKFISIISANILLGLSGCRGPEEDQKNKVIELTKDWQEQTSSEEFSQAIKTGKWNQEIILPKYVSDIESDESAKSVSEFLFRFSSIEKNIRQITGVATLYGGSEEVTSFQVEKGSLTAIDILYLGSRKGTAAIHMKNAEGNIVWESEKLDESQEYFLLMDGEKTGNYTLCWHSDIVIQTEEDIPKAPYIMVNVLSIPQEYQQLFEGGINVP